MIAVVVTMIVIMTMRRRRTMLRFARNLYSLEKTAKRLARICQILMLQPCSHARNIGQLGALEVVTM